MSLNESTNQLLIQALHHVHPDLATEILSISVEQDFFQRGYSLTFISSIIQFHTVQILLYNIQNKITYLQNLFPFSLQHFKGTSDEFLSFIKQLRISPILTAHPTEPLSSEAIILLEEIEQYFSQPQLLLPLLIKLLQTKLVPSAKHTVEAEVEDNLRYLKNIYSAYNLFVEAVITAFQLHFKQPAPSELYESLQHCLAPRSWTGGDADGNLQVTPTAMQAAAEMHLKNNILVPIDVRQSAMKLKKAEAGDVTEEHRLTMMKQYPTVFRRLVISNVESSEDILVATRLVKKFALEVEIIPLFESYNSLKNAAQIIAGAIDWHGDTVMVGYSDSEKEAGIFVLAILDKAIEEIQQIITPRKLRVFHGCGLDLGRGGPHINALEQTIQGNHKRFAFSSPENICNYFINVLNTALFPKHNSTLEVEAAVVKYRDFLVNKAVEIDQYLQYASPFWLFVKPCNFSSRTTKRDATEESNPFLPWINKSYLPEEKVLLGLRAISQVNAIEGSWSFFNLWYGADQFNWQQSSDRVKDFQFKVLYGLHFYDVEMQLLFNAHPEMLHHLKQQFLLVSKALEGYYLPAHFLKTLNEKEILFNKMKKLMTYITRAVITDKTPFYKLLPSTSNDEKYSKELLVTMGTLYVAFTEYRTIAKTV